MNAMQAKHEAADLDEMMAHSKAWGEFVDARSKMVALLDDLRARRAGPGHDDATDRKMMQDVRDAAAAEWDRFTAFIDIERVHATAAKQRRRDWKHRADEFAEELSEAIHEYAFEKKGRVETFARYEKMVKNDIGDEMERKRMLHLHLRRDQDEKKALERIRTAIDAMADAEMSYSVEIDFRDKRG